MYIDHVVIVGRNANNGTNAGTFNVNANRLTRGGVVRLTQRLYGGTTQKILFRSSINN